MGMIFTEDFTNDAGALFIRRVMPHTQVIHRKKYAAVYGLEAVTYIRQGAGNDNAHGVIQV